MNADPRFEQRVIATLNRTAATREPEGLLDSVVSTVSRTRTRPRWLALVKEPPMRIHSRVAVGSPTVRLVYLSILALLLVVLATGAVAAGASLLPTPAIVVAQDGSGTVRTITEAVAIARDGDTVLVKPGTYLESIAITADITLRGDGDRKAVIIDFATSGPTHAFDAGPFAYGILLVDSDAYVENITLHGRPDGGETPLSAVVIDGGAPVLEQFDVILDDAPFPDYPFFMRSAFQVLGGSTAVVRNGSWDGYTRVIDPASSPTFLDNTISAQIVSIWDGDPVIRRNTFLDGASIGFSGTTTGGIAEDNDIMDGWIIAEEGADGATIRNNRIRQPNAPDAGSGERGAAIRILVGTSPVVEGNTISDSPFGIEIVGFGAKPRISGNTISGSTSAAIIVDGGAAPAIDRNVIEGNGTGIEVMGTSTPVLTANKLCQNGTDLTVPEGSTITLDGNTVCADAASPAP